MSQPAVSVIISVFNRKEHMEKCLAAMLKSSYKNYDLIVVDGGSRDGTLEMLREAEKKNKKLKVFVDKTPGRNPARNTGIKKATGELLIFVDSDCIVDKNWMKEIVRPFDDPTVGGVIGRTIADKKGLFWYHMENDYLQFIGHNSAYRKSIIKKIGCFDLRFKTAREDTDLAWTVIDLGYKMVHCNNAVMTHLSRRVSARYRIKNQRAFIYDGLLYRKHKNLYKKYFYVKGMPATLWPSIFSPVVFLFFVYSLIFYRTIADVMIFVYIIIVVKKLIGNKNGTLRENAEFFLLIWILPLSRVYYFMKGWIFVRDKI
ncbi:MAG: glycosyltransferase [Candidatus Aenigmarchaeota archaeon]|nr:glycosyltransferase [Candidatus Aenigmarchaeota archaeon]